tara:strand:+ start:1201 stop:1905 length:705 start_codon:yes stop_codon:yes gene_type:complete
METSELTNEISAALSAAQGEFALATKNSINPAFRSQYANLAAVIDAVRGPLAKYKLCIVQEGTADKERQAVSVLTRISHASGQWIQTGPLSIPVTKADPFGYGSAYTYAKRYAVLAALALASEDDDGVGAAGAAPRPAAAPAAPAGFDGWSETLTEASTLGLPELKRAWAASPAHYRAFITTHNPDRWGGLKLAAATYTADLETRRAAELLTESSHAASPTKAVKPLARKVTTG